MTTSFFSPHAPWLAPLAGWSDLPFRLLCRHMGAGVTCTEMISAKGLVYGGRNTEALLAVTEDDTPLIAQIFGAEPEFMGQAVTLLRDRGYSWFDVNMGCSVPKVTKTGAGAALLKTPQLAQEIGQAVIEAAGRGRAGFKLRLDWEPEPDKDDICFSLARNLQENGAGWISIHPRYARQGFSGQADHRATARLVSECSIPVIASGDLMGAADGIRIIRETGAATVMYARGALIDPGIFSRHHALLAGDNKAGNALNSREELAAIISAHASLARTLAPESAILKMRTFVPRYVKHLDGAKALRNKLIHCSTWEQLAAILQEDLHPAPWAETGQSPILSRLHSCAPSILL